MPASLKPMLSFESHFGRSATIQITSPGRINLIGEHIDYLGGKVMPIAIENHLTILAGRLTERVVEIFPEGLGFGSPVRIDLDHLEKRTDPAESWMNYVIGVLAVYEASGIVLPGFCAQIDSNLPTGAGLSSSAALETGIALAIEAFSGVEQDSIDRALLCQRAEHEFAGVPCGIMDQIAVGAGREGHALLLDCSNLSIHHVSMPADLAVVTADTGVKHALGDGEYRKRREDCDEILKRLGLSSFHELSSEILEASASKLDEKLFRRARHAVTEMQRVDLFATALESSDQEALGQLMKASHESLRVDYEVSCQELDFLVETAYALPAASGVIGSRMTGGGFGGSTVTLVQCEKANSLIESLKKSYEEKFGRSLNCFITSAVEGAKTSIV
ncbi:MAG: galactokinase [Verrucomicrobiales bacterium]|nr:galactokinase [Verrucomicrobiales bacterium]